MTPEELKGIRERAKMTQVEMAKKLGVSKITYQQWEWGRRSPGAATRKLIATLFPPATDEK